MDTKHEEYIEKLLERAMKADDAVKAINFSQAACNAANALRVLAEIKRLAPT